jgi:hypothetical protein
VVGDAGVGKKGLGIFGWGGGVGVMVREEGGWDVVGEEWRVDGR